MPDTKDYELPINKPERNYPYVETTLVNREGKSDLGKNTERYGDAGSDLPSSREDNNHAYKLNRK